MGWQDEYNAKFMSAEEAAQLLQPGDVLRSGIGADARSLIPALFARVVELGMNVRIISSSPSPAQEWFGDEYAELGFDLSSEIFAGATARVGLMDRRVDWYPSLFSNSFNVWDRLPESEREPMDYFHCSVTAPDENGYMGTGGLAWQKLDYIERSRTSVVEVCPFLPDVPGERIHVSQVSAIIPTALDGLPLLERAGTDAAATIAGFVNEIIEDGDTCQIGAGRTATFLPEFGAFHGKKDLGWHSEITPAGVVQLMMEGVFNSSRKTYDVGLHVTASVNARTQEHWDWLNSNPPLEARRVTSVNHIMSIGRHERFTAINNAFEVDLTGQVYSEAIGTRVYNGTGGQTEFHIGAAISPGGKAITVVPATATGGTITRIVAPGPAEGYVTVPRTFADFVVTEFGIARLGGKSQRQRAEQLIAIAHPDHRGELRDAINTHFYPSGVRASALGD
ncbi:MAG: acetyl-CoA hydrolase/transferase C-terminal domain-containing protein [Dehalococcoidia bacterium]